MSPPLRPRRHDARWTIYVSKATDRALREYLGRSGGRKGELSRFVEDAVQDRLRRATIAEAQAHNELVPDEELTTAIAAALRWARAEG